jgi:hypothetical protein
MTVIKVDFKSKTKKVVEEETKENTLAPTNFEELIKKNKENEERLKKERAQDNKNVKRSYRIE